MSQKVNITPWLLQNNGFEIQFCCQGCCRIRIVLQTCLEKKIHICMFTSLQQCSFYWFALGCPGLGPFVLHKGPHWFGNPILIFLLQNPHLIKRYHATMFTTSFFKNRPKTGPSSLEKSATYSHHPFGHKEIAVLTLFGWLLLLSQLVHLCVITLKWTAPDFVCKRTEPLIFLQIVCLYTCQQEIRCSNLSVTYSFCFTSTLWPARDSICLCLPMTQF